MAKPIVRGSEVIVDNQAWTVVRRGAPNFYVVEQGQRRIMVKRICFRDQDVFEFRCEVEN